jgi:phage host-nuclease inhibitor protein Gam
MAAKSKRVKQAAAEYPMPQTKEQTVEAIAEIGRRQRERQRIEAAMNDELAAVKERHETQAAPHKDAIQALSQGVQTWCEAHRDELTQGGKVKTAALPSGEVRWRLRPPSVAIRGADVVIETLRKLGLGRFIRTKDEINKEAILADMDAVQGVKGIAISQGEDFVIVPFETELEEVA